MSAVSTRGANARIPEEMPFRPHLAGARPAPEAAAPVEFDGGAVQFADDAVVGAATGLRAVLSRIEQVSPTEVPVLLEGETGSGKELIARVLHTRSRRVAGPMIRVNCGAIPRDLVDSELFGHERGSFTGATNTRLGWFERANGGTLFLDEVAELPLAAQVRLLRVLQEGALQRVGGSKTIHVSVRIVTATHRDLRAMCTDGTFREDLWYRIGVFSVRIPPLRDRPFDIPALATHFARRSGLRLTSVPLVPTEAEIAALQRYHWPGNVRELAAVVERAAILGGGLRLDIAGALGDSSPSARRAPDPAPHRATDPAGAFLTLADAMRAHIGEALKRTSGQIEGPAGAAALLGLNPHTLRGKMRKLKIDWASYRT
jgi:transcriptional regulator with GAF, ATPase, and Fis domain